MTVTQPHAASSIDDVRVDIAGLAGKIDTLAAMIAAQGKASDDHEERIRANEAAIQDLKAEKPITWPKLWAAICAAAVVVALVFPILSDAFQHIERVP